MNKESNSRILRKMVAAIFALALTSALFFVGTSNAEASSYPTAPRVTGSGVEMVSTWDCVYFGNYPQTYKGTGDKNNVANYNNDKIKWRVLSVDGISIFLLSDKSLENQKYNESEVETTWATSTIRSWLNGLLASSNNDGIDYSYISFKDVAFTSAEQLSINTTEVINSNNPNNGVNGGVVTKDKIYLLSIGEGLNPSFGFANNNEVTKTRVAQGTDYTTEKLSGATNNWWLRSPGGSLKDAALVGSDGYLYSYYGATVNNGSYSVRPALHINLDSGGWTNAGTINSEGVEVQPVNISLSATTGGTASGDGSHYYGTEISVTATANAGYRFVNWTESGTAVSTLATYDFTAHADRELTANFAKTTVSIVVSAGTGGMASGGGSHYYDADASVTAAANAGYRFVNWTESGTAVSTSYGVSPILFSVFLSSKFIDVPIA